MRNRHRGAVCILGGVLLIAAAAALTLYNLREDEQAAASASQTLTLLQQELPAPSPAVRAADTPTEITDETVVPDYILNPDMDMPVERVDGLDCVGVLEIPALELTLPILDQWSDAAAKSAPCRYTGSAYQDDLVIAGHNYRAHFANLKNTPEGSAVYFTDMDGNRFAYEVVLTETLHATDVEEMCGGGWDLTLFTCTMSGQYRAAVRCQRSK